jgi:ATPase family associated with various cellular activities (AAA)
MQTMNQMLDTFRRARVTGTPFIWVETFDALASLRRLLERADLNGETSHVATFDLAKGLQAFRDNTTAVLGTAAGKNDPVDAFDWLGKAPEGTILAVFGAHDVLLKSGEPRPVETMALWHLRDLIKQNFRMVLLFSHTTRVPADLQHDVTVLHEPLPTTDDLAAIVRRTYSTNPELPEPDDETVRLCVDNLIGVPMFPAEQVASMSLRKAGMDRAMLQERRIEAINSQRGLTVWGGGEKRTDVGGCAGIIKFLEKMGSPKAKRRPRLVVWLDEVEKQMGGVGGGDLSGTADDQHGQMLQHMQNTNAGGLMFVGHPGTAKSLIAKAAADILGVLCVQLDMGAMRGSLQGESEQHMRAALQVIEQLSQGQALWIATSNGIAKLPPEFVRRFKLGTYFFDLPSAEERDSIWSVYETKLQLPKQKRPDDAGWNGAEIAQCADFADRFGCSLVEAAEDIVPLAISQAPRIAKLRDEADGKYRSAAGPGRFRQPQSSAVAAGDVARRKFHDE